MKDQRQAGYTRGDPINHCGVCSKYQGGHRCSEVSGDISPFGVCRSDYVPERNPFGSTLAPNEVATIKAMAADAQDRSRMRPQGPMMRGPQMGSIAAPGPAYG